MSTDNEKNDIGEGSGGDNDDSQKRFEESYELYPERKTGIPDKSFLQKFFKEPPLLARAKCFKKVYDAMIAHPLIRLMLQSLEEAGCPFDITRHISCEPCLPPVTGGYDPELNQIVVCSSSGWSMFMPDAVIIHELIHMYDNCVNKIDFKNMEHLACTEIRAANLTHCSFLSSVSLGQSSPINIKETHQYCVKLKAVQSLMGARGVDFDTALKHVLKVFDKCYNDLEPIGRRVRRNSCDLSLALKEFNHFSKQRKLEEDKAKKT